VGVLKVRSSRSSKNAPAAGTAAGTASSRHRVPDARPALRQRAASAMSEGPLKGLTVLVVEDDSDARYIFRKMLTLEGALVLEAPEGVAALALCRSDARIDVILCDLLMPWLDGFGFMRALRLMRRRRHVPVIAVTALSQDRDFLRTFNTGFARHLTKPIDIETLTQTILTVTPPKSRS
jgi:two-component system CheB/CheR fusion protein